MILVPSLSVSKGKIVRLTAGDYSKETVYEDTPLDTAMKLKEHGIKRIHLIDLDGATGTSVNYDILQMIVNYSELTVNFAGGLHTDGDIQKALEYGAESITAASVAFLNPQLFANWVMSYGREKIAMAADSLHGKIQIKGWKKQTEKDLFEHIEYFYERGLKYLKSTDIAKDGALQGPPFQLYEELMKRFPDLKIFASGGVRNMDDIRTLDDMGLHGAIFGKAYYEGAISLKEIESYNASH